MNIYFSADTHFGHERVTQFCPNRKELGDTVETHDEALIKRWNETVRPIDRVYFLGDFAFQKDRAIGILNRLNGTIHFIPGNHDNAIMPILHTMGKIRIRPPLLYERIGETSVVFSHYPLLEWRNSFHGTYMLHGHSHNQHPESIWRRMDVGIDAHPEMRPWSLVEIRAKLEPRPFQDQRLYKEHST